MTLSGASLAVGVVFAVLAIIAWSLQGYFRSERHDSATFTWMVVAIVLTLVMATFWIMSAYQAVRP